MTMFGHVNMKSISQSHATQERIQKILVGGDAVLNKLNVS